MEFNVDIGIQSYFALWLLLRCYHRDWKAHVVNQVCQAFQELQEKLIG